MSRGRPRRFELTAEEHERAQQVRDAPITMSDILRAHVRNPRLIPETVRTLSRGAKAGLQQDAALVWAVHADRIRRAVPDAATGVDWHGVDGFMRAVESRLSPSTRALEIGCGAGRVSRRIAPLVGELVCSDVSPIALAEARGTLADVPNVDFAQTSGFRLDPFPDASFDAVMSHDVFLVFDPNQALALIDESRRVLRDGGWFAASFVTMDESPWADAQLRVVRRAARSDRFNATQPRAYVTEQVDALCWAANLEVVERIFVPQGEGPDARGHYVVVAEARERRPQRYR